VGFAGGHELFNSTEQFRCASLGGGTYGGSCPQIFETNSEGDRTDIARIKSAAAADVQYDPWIEDASYVRLRTIGARIDVPPPLIERFGARRASFTLVAENLMLSTGYSGVDPEVSSDGASDGLRVDFLTLPPARRVTGRFEVVF
jgi:hypothetical protein